MRLGTYKLDMVRVPDVFLCYHLVLEKFHSHLTIVITFKRKISRGMRCATARCQQPTHGIGHHKKVFPLGTGERNVNVQSKCLACLRTQISRQDSPNGRAVFSGV